MNYAQIKTHDTADGPGVRVSLFVSGCTHHCKGCFNPETWNFDYGSKFTEQTENMIIEALKPNYIRGLSLLGGEPFEEVNIQALTPFLEKVRKIYPEKTIWCYSGYCFEELAVCDYAVRFLEYIDVLVDGEYIEELRNLRLRFRGSSNQRILDVKKSLTEGRAIISEKNVPE